MANWVSYEKFDINDLVFDEIRISDKGSKSVGIKYHYTEVDKNGVSRRSPKPGPLKILLPELKTWGASVYLSEWSMNCPLSSETAGPLEALFSLIDERVIDYVYEKSKALLGTQKSKEIVREFMTKTVKSSLDKRTSEVKENFIKIKLASYDNKWNFLVCNEDGEAIFNRDSRETPDVAIPKHAMCDTIVSLPSIWVSTNKFGYSIKLVQAGITPTEKKVSLYDECVLPRRKAARVTKAEVDDDDDDEDHVETELVAEKDFVDDEESQAPATL